MKRGPLAILALALLLVFLFGFSLTGNSIFEIFGFEKQLDEDSGSFQEPSLEEPYNGEVADTGSVESGKSNADASGEVSAVLLSESLEGVDDLNVEIKSDGAFVNAQVLLDFFSINSEGGLVPVDFRELDVTSSLSSVSSFGVTLGVQGTMRARVVVKHSVTGAVLQTTYSNDFVVSSNIVGGKPTLSCGFKHTTLRTNSKKVSAKGGPVESGWKYTRDSHADPYWTPSAEEREIRWVKFLAEKDCTRKLAAKMDDNGDLFDFGCADCLKGKEFLKCEKRNYVSNSPLGSAIKVSSTYTTKTKRAGPMGGTLKAFVATATCSLDVGGRVFQTYGCVDVCSLSGSHDWETRTNPAVPVVINKDS